MRVSLTIASPGASPAPRGHHHQDRQEHEGTGLKHDAGLHQLVRALRVAAAGDRHDAGPKDRKHTDEGDDEKDGEEGLHRNDMIASTVEFTTAQSRLAATPGLPSRASPTKGCGWAISPPAAGFACDTVRLTHSFTVGARQKNVMLGRHCLSPAASAAGRARVRRQSWRPTNSPQMAVRRRES